MVDLHAHVLPGIDDGPETVEEALSLLEHAARHGVTAVAATPHVNSEFPTTPEAVRAGVGRMAELLARRHVPLRLLPGAEVHAGVLPTLTADELRAFSLAGRGRHLLVELPWDAPAPEALGELRRLAGLGLTPVIAHPERYAYVQDAPGHLEALVAAGALAQVTASSLLGLDGRAAAAAARMLIGHGLVHLLAGDAHGGAVRRAGLWEVRAALRNEALADWLTRGMPQAIVDGAPPPPPPARSPGRRLRLTLPRRR